LFGSFLIPSRASANFLSGLFGGDVSANADAPILNNADVNSQNMGLLEAKVSSATVIEDKKTKNTKDKIDETKNVNILSENALVPATGPAGVSDDTDEDISPDQISVYVVRKDDSITQIAKMFDVTPNTIRWANDIKVGQKLNEGDILIILPIDGVKITVAKNQTLKSLGTKYKVDPTDIAGFNGISEDAKLVVGDELIIPNGIIADEGGSTTIKSSSSSAKKYYDTQNLPTIIGYFMNPMPNTRLTQGLHDKGGIDLAAPKGTPVRASALGTVIFARMGYNGGYGNMIMLSHSNGTQTLYGHLFKINVSVGEQVNQGEQIGAEGSTGRSTGPHLHFKVIGAKNPGAFLRVGSTLDANWK